MAIAVDSRSPDWNGWKVIESIFASLFSLDLSARVFLDRRHMEHWRFNVFDAIICIVDWFGISFSYIGSTSSNDVGMVSSLRFIRILKLARFARLVRFIGMFPGLVELLHGFM